MFLGFCGLKLSTEPDHLKVRDNRFDVLKALAMWFVIVWHVCTTPRLNESSMRDLFAVAGVVSISYPILLLPRSRLVSRVANWGRTTMGGYFMHQAVLSSFILPMVKDHEMSVFNVLFVATLLMLCCHFVVCSFGGGS